MSSICRLSKERILRHVLVGLIALILAVGCDRIVAAPTPTSSPTAIRIPTPSSSDPGPMLPTPPSRDLEDQFTRLTSAQRTPLSSAPARPHDYPVGIKQDFSVWHSTSGPDWAFDPKPFRLAVKTDHAYWYVEDNVNVPLADLQSAANYFEEQTYPIEHQMFGWEIPPGIDGDRRVTILIGQITWPDGVDVNIDDLRPRWVYPTSNERKIIYVTGEAFRPGLHPFKSGIAQSLARIAWETSHPFQDYWVKLGFQDFVTEAVTGSADDVLASKAIDLFALDPEVQLNSWRVGQPDFDAARVAGYLFARYVAERFGGTSIFPRIFSGTGRGVAAYEQAFQSDVHPTTFDNVFADWVAANALGDGTLQDGQYGYRDRMQVNPNVIPGPVLGTSVSGKATQYGTTYYRVQPTASATLRFTGDSTVALVAVNPREGRYEWWSNRGDNIDSRLTRRVDLRAVTSASLHFWTWFDIEKDYDYAYVEASTDNGATWQTLSTPDTTRDNPHSANLGDGFTGTSGVGTPHWVQEAVDLTPLAGKEIFLRFEYVTDTATLGDGFVVDGIVIPGIGFRDSTDSDNGWVAEGFVRTDNVAPQPWLVEVLRHNPQNPVRRLTIRPDGTGSVPLEAGQSVIVAVAGLSPNTNQRSQFQLSLTPR